MAGAADDWLVRIAQAFDGFAYCIDAGRVERRGRAQPVAVDLNFQATLGGDLVDECTRVGLHVSDSGIFVVAKIKGKRHVARDGVPRGASDLQLTNCDEAFGGKVARQLFQCSDHFANAEQRVMSKTVSYTHLTLPTTPYV